MQAAQKGDLVLFVESGLSRAHKLPTWEGLLENLHRLTAARHNEIPTFDEIKAACRDDYLRIAQYLSLVRNDRGQDSSDIQEICRLPDDADILTPGTHTDLVNLGASYICTTNYDRLLEDTFRALNLEHRRIVTPKDLLTRRGSSGPDLIKLHGDPKDAQSIVLTEDSYLDRMAQTSLVDDYLLSNMYGRSVLFIGFSLSDFDVRILMHKYRVALDQHDTKWGPHAWWVSSDWSDVADKIRLAAGIGTIRLPAPEGATDADKSAAETRNLANYLLDLALAVGSDHHSQHISTTLLSRAISAVEQCLLLEDDEALAQIDDVISSVTERLIPHPTQPQFRELFESFPENDLRCTPARRRLAAHALGNGFCTEGMARFLLDQLLNTSDAPDLVRAIDDLTGPAPFPWRTLFEVAIPLEIAKEIVELLESEIVEHERGWGRGLESSLVITFDLACRLESTELKVMSGLSADLQDQLTQLIPRARNLYSVDLNLGRPDWEEFSIRGLLAPLRKYEPRADHGPSLEAVAAITKVLDPDILPDEDDE